MLMLVLIYVDMYNVTRIVVIVFYNYVQNGLVCFVYAFDLYIS